jgi:uncharacterized protein (UPF0548 family)
VERYRLAVLDAAPTFDGPSGGDVPDGFRHERFHRSLGVGPDVFERARDGIRHWEAHRGAGMQVAPPTTPIEPRW